MKLFSSLMKCNFQFIMSGVERIHCMICTFKLTGMFNLLSKMRPLLSWLGEHVRVQGFILYPFMLKESDYFFRLSGPKILSP